MRAPKTKGIGWEVFDSTGSSDGEMQIQVIAEPELDLDLDDPRCVSLTPAFKDDAEAIRHVIKLAKRGDKEAIEALWEVLPYDGLVNRIFWNMNFKSFPIAFPGPDESDLPEW